MDDLLTFLPPEWAAWLRILAEVSFALSLLAAAFKPMLGDPAPGLDPRWKQIAFWLVKWVDWLAVNTETVRAKDKRVMAVQNARLQRRHMNAPLFMLAIALMPSLACAGSQLRSHALIADSASKPILAAKHLLEQRMASDASDVRERVTNPEAQQLEMDALQASYAPVEGVFEALREAYNTYVDAITKAHETGTDISHEAALALLSRWQPFVDAARDMGLEVPQPPESLRSLGGSP